MVQKPEHEPRLDTNSQEESTLSKQMSRRGFLGLTAAAGVGFVLAGCGEGSIAQDYGEEDLRPEKKANDLSISSSEAETNIESLIMPDHYKNRPWADPSRLTSLTIEQRAESVGVLINDNTRTNRGFVDMLGKNLETIGNGGRTVEDALKARQMGIPVGERDALGNTLSNYADYTLPEYISPMLKSLFSSIADAELHEDCVSLLSDFLAQESGIFSAAMRDPDFVDKATLYLRTEFEKEVSDNRYERSMRISLEADRIDLYEVGDEHNSLYQGHMIVGINEGQGGKFDIEMNEFYMRDTRVKKIG